MHVADLSADMRVLKIAQQEAQQTIANDPQLEKPENQPLKNRIQQVFQANADTWN
jgi:hypothetical protein